MSRVPFSEFPELVRAIVNHDGEETARRRDITRDALMFTMLTWARTSETRFAIWDEFEDLEGAHPLWRIPSERMKMEREHLVPLSTQVVELLRARRHANNSQFVFSGIKPEKPISENTMIYACYRMGYLHRQTVHGFRGLASTWANEAECFKADWIEMALAHANEDDVRGACNSALYLSPRRLMLQQWADMIDKAVCEERVPVIQSAREPRIPLSGRRTTQLEPGVANLQRPRVHEPYWQASKSRTGRAIGPAK